MKKNLILTIVTLLFLSTTLSSSTSILKVESRKALKFNYDYDRGYNQSYDLGTAGDYALFGSRYNTALQNDRFDLAEGMLDGYNAGRENGPNQSPGQGGGNPTSDGCKIVINDASLTSYLNSLGFGCYVNFQ